MAIILEIGRFMVRRKKFWLVPVLIVFAIFGGMLILAKGSVVAPFLYTLF